MGGGCFVENETSSETETPSIGVTQIPMRIILNFLLKKTEAAVLAKTIKKTTEDRNDEKIKPE